MVQGLAARADLADHNEEELGNYWACAVVDSGKDYSFFRVLTYFIKQKLFILYSFYSSCSQKYGAFLLEFS